MQEGVCAVLGYRVFEHFWQLSDSYDLAELYGEALAKMWKWLSDTARDHKPISRSINGEKTSPSATPNASRLPRDAASALSASAPKKSGT